jgi:hypothetical protein
MTVGRARPVARPIGLGGTGPESRVLRVDTYQAAPPEMACFATLNPFHFDQAWRIPVPGQAGMFACSVEAVWQGLKVHNGQTDFPMFSRPPYKRPADEDRGAGYSYPASRFRFGNGAAGGEVDLVTARLVIYLPAYLYLLERLVPDEVMARIGQALAAGDEVLFYDWDDNFDILDPGASFSHSALLAAWFNGTLDEQFLRPQSALLADRPELTHPDVCPLLDRYRHRQNGSAEW